MKKELILPSSGMIEKIAIEFAGVWFDAARSSGHVIKGFTTARKFAKHNFESFIPHALKHCFEMLNDPKFDAGSKQIIYDEIMKRANDPEARAMFPSSTENDKHLNNFELPKDFIEKNFPKVAEQLRKANANG